MSRPGIPTGFCPKAQGCEARATLGERPPNIPNRNAVAADPFSPLIRERIESRTGASRVRRRITAGSDFKKNCGRCYESTKSSGTTNTFGIDRCRVEHGRNPVGVVGSFRRSPRVARSSQPWAGGHNPFGIARNSGPRRRRPATHSHGMARWNHPTVSVLAKLPGAISSSARRSGGRRRRRRTRRIDCLSKIASSGHPHRSRSVGARNNSLSSPGHCASECR